MTILNAIKDLDAQGFKIRKDEKAYLPLKDGTLEIFYDDKDKVLKFDIHDEDITKLSTSDNQHYISNKSSELTCSEAIQEIKRINKGEIIPMPNINTTKSVTLPRLINFAWKHKVKSTKFKSNDGLGSITFDNEGRMKITDSGLNEHSKFEITFKEPIGEFTTIPYLLKTVRKCTKPHPSHSHEEGVKSHLSSYIVFDSCIKHIEMAHLGSDTSELLTIHMINEDGTHTLLWKHGAVVK